MKKFLLFLTITLALFGTVFGMYWKYLHPHDYMVFVESYDNGVVTIDHDDTSGTDRKFRVKCKKGEEITLNINPERTENSYYNLSKLVVNGVDVTKKVKMLQYKTVVDQKLSVLAFFKQGKRPAGYTVSQSTSTEVEAPVIAKVSENDYLGAVAAYDIEDPTIFYDTASGTYYCFGSDNVVIKSQDLVNWTNRTTYFEHHENAESNAIMTFSQFPSVAKWAKEHGYDPDENFSDDNNDRTPHSPDIVKVGSTYYLYFSLTKSKDTNESAIFCVKTNDISKAISLKKWTDVGLVISSCGTHGGAVTTVDDDGQDIVTTADALYDSANAVHPGVIYVNNALYMVYGGYYGKDSMNGSINLIELSPKTGLIKQASKYNDAGVAISTLHGKTQFNSGTLLAAPGKLSMFSKSKNMVSAPQIVYNEKTGYYYLFVTYGYDKTNYSIRVGRSKAIEGPYTDYNGASLADSSSGQYKKGFLLMNGYNFVNSSEGSVSYTDVGRASIGSPKIIKSADGTWFIASQSQLYYKIGETITTGFIESEETTDISNTDPSLEVRQLEWTDDGWPMAMPEMYSGKKALENVKIDDLYGGWDILVLDKSGIGSDYKSIERSASQRATILKQAVITQSDIKKNKELTTTGTFAKRGKGFSVVLDGVEYTVRAYTVWDWELRDSSIVIAGVGTDGSTIWGKKNFSPTLGINTDAFYYLYNKCDEKGQASYQKKINSISSNPSQAQIDAMTEHAIKYLKLMEQRAAESK